MKNLFAILLVAALCGCIGQPPVNRTGDSPPSTVAQVDLSKYAGLWYEIARYPNGFEKNCTGVTAEYAQLPDGKISVTNTCRKNSLDGKVDVAEGRAWVVDEQTNAKLKVKFAPSWVPFAAGDYWILALDKEYESVLVGAPNGRYLWILARTAQISDERLAELKAVATAKGYNAEALEMTIQK